MSTRTFRLAPTDQSGWILGLGPAQVLPLGAGLLVALVVLSRTESLMLALVPGTAGAVLGFLRIGDTPIFETVPTVWRFVVVRRHRRFEAVLPHQGSQPSLPWALDGQEILVAKLDGNDLAVVADTRNNLLAATLRVEGTQFLLAAPNEQARLLEAFGDALAPLCRPASRVVNVRWTSMAAPGPTAAPRTYGAERISWSDTIADIEASCNAVRHEVLITVTVHDRTGQPTDVRLADVCEETRLLISRLRDAGLAANPLDLNAWSGALRRRLDPAGSAAARSLAEVARLVVPSTAGPLCAEESWRMWRVDGTCHRAFHISQWPRVDLSAGWMPDLLLALPAPRLVTVIFEPVPPRTSRRAIDRLSAKMDSDEEHRRRAGFRVGAQHDAARAALVARETELASGYPEFDYVGLVVMSGAEPGDLEDRSAEAMSAAAACGIELRPLHGRHPAAVAACLPLARSLSPGGRR